MWILLRKLLPVTVAIILGLLVAAPSQGQQDINPITGDRNKIVNADYPLMPDSIMEAELTRIDGTKFRLKDLRGKVVLLNLWAIWLGPSRSQIPKLMELQEKYDQGRFLVVGLSAGDGNGHLETLRDIRKFSASYHLNYPLVRASGRSSIDAFFNLTKQSVLPQLFLIGIDGTLRGVFIGGGTRVDAVLRETAEKVVKESEGLAILKGSVTDLFGSLIPYVKITARTKNGTTFECHTNDSGEYSVAMPSGSYAISFSKTPFDMVVIPQYQLPLHSIMTLDISMTCENCAVVH